MRPPISDLTSSRSRKSSFEQPRSEPRSGVPSTFFLSRSSGYDYFAESSPDDSDTSRDSMYGVQSLDETVQEASLAASQSEFVPPVINGTEPHSQPDNLNDNDDSRSRPTFRTSERLSPSKPFNPQQHCSDNILSSPLTPFNLSFQNASSSLPSSPKSTSNNSLRPLDDISITDDLSSQAVASGEEDNDPVEALTSNPDTVSQLIMPSIRMPTRRPFTERGKAMGRLKVAVAGSPGSGKTSLIKSLVQACEDIVHIDPLFPLSPDHRHRRSHPQSRHDHSQSSPVISEFYASTKPYPSWWTDLEDSRVLRRRKSTGDIILERNLCFVDTPQSSLNQNGQTDAIVQYIRQQLLRTFSALDSSMIDFQNMLAGNGGSQVDAILYLISEETLVRDIECMRKLCDLTNIIPVIAKADLLSSNQISSLKSLFNKQAECTALKTFNFGDLPPEGANELGPLPPFAVSSAKSNDDDTMDASTLMSPDYVQPLAPSELCLLAQKLFDRDNISWMRHSAAKKLAQKHWQAYRSQDTAQGSSFVNGQSSVSGFISPNSSVYTGSLVSLPGTSSPSYTLARITDYTHREEMVAQVRLAKWALDLQQSLQNERERYAALSKGDRAIWLAEQLNESVMDGSLVPVSQTPGVHDFHISTEKRAGGFMVRPSNGQRMEYHTSRLSPHDPLGVVWWTDDLKRRGWAIVQIVGGFGVVGGLTLWLAKTWGLQMRNLSEWNFHWCGTNG
ncbi:hypothetical protein PHISCL_01584 [Aspergillus sclerotialis]|uniref:Septin-type G domain-containing protein n=1 Tax=Aspergillus sclerotialis TaxID=2070753 RepID=A0A3A2ZSD4_9EURO|nr:hypothetical protein PHISCL_01584 [Aspergillus sclerotialis]